MCEHVRVVLEKHIDTVPPADGRLPRIHFSELALRHGPADQLVVSDSPAPQVVLGHTRIVAKRNDDHTVPRLDKSPAQQREERRMPCDGVVDVEGDDYENASCGWTSQVVAITDRWIFGKS